jgi:hypothetical protein
MIVLVSCMILLVVNLFGLQIVPGASLRPNWCHIFGILTLDSTSKYFEVHTFLFLQSRNYFEVNGKIEEKILFEFVTSIHRSYEFKCHV